jgi:hypothetical protein
LNDASAAWDKWSGYYEDIPKDTVNVNNRSPMMTAYYILDREDPATVDPAWKTHVGYLLDRGRALLGRGPYFGAWGIDEQLRPDGALIGGVALAEQGTRDVLEIQKQQPAFGPPPNQPSADYDTEPRVGGALLGTAGRGCCSRTGVVSQTALWGAINAMYFERTGDGQSREDAFRTLNYATYFINSQDIINTAGGDFNQFWFEDGYGDAGRSFSWALGAVPDFAPIGQDHLLRSSSVVQSVTYAQGGIEYRTFHDSATEVLRLTYSPSSVSADGKALPLSPTLEKDSYTIQSLSDGDYVVRVRHGHSNRIRVDGPKR